ncbi:hypothetical protein AXF42_Ash017920 [Apostasia shenzhenica]|uniref:Uncharacterized protein n=1 Tax=Apostasia shenzhenica TaxID=1088818 RepID=A0A2I0AYA1_9ASPA|nr:hypothetical protein AXF42_Ash017920 [Apostasia shenzhenica]
MVGLNDSCPCCGHKRRWWTALDRWASCPAPQITSAIPHPAKFARSSSFPAAHYHPSQQSPSPPPPPSPAAANHFHHSGSAALPLPPPPPPPDKEEECKKEEADQEEKKDARDVKMMKLKISGAEGVKINIKCECGSLQEIALCFP